MDTVYSIKLLASRATNNQLEGTTDHMISDAKNIFTELYGHGFKVMPTIAIFFWNVSNSFIFLSKVKESTAFDILKYPLNNNNNKFFLTCLKRQSCKTTKSNYHFTTF